MDAATRLRSRTAICLCLVVSLGKAADASPVIQRAAAEPPAREHWTLREAWRAGGDDDEAVLLGQVGAAISGPGGEVYALDSQLSQVLVFDAEGRHVRTLGRDGEGPGEFRRPTDLYLVSADRLAVQQVFPGRLVYLDPRSGTPLGQWQVGKDEPEAGGFQLLFGSRERGGVHVVAAGQNAFDAQAGSMRDHRYLALLDPSGKPHRRLAEQSGVRDLQRPVRDDLADHFAGDRGLWDVGPDGRTYLVPRYDEYLIRVCGPDGAPVMDIARDHAARLRTEEEKAEQRNSTRMNVGGRELEIAWKQHDRARSITRLQVLDDGTLWVTGSHADRRWREAGERVFDVYGPDGRLRSEVTVAVPAGGPGNRLLLLQDGRFLLVKGQETLAIMIGAGSGGSSADLAGTRGDDMLELICYEREP